MQFTLIEFNGPGFVTAELKKSGDQLKIRFETSQAPEAVWPSSQPLHRADELWQNTCFELFIAAVDSTAYTELNLSPNGGWNAYDFDDYRQNMRPGDKYNVVRLARDGEYCFDAQVSLRTSLARELVLAPCAVLATTTGELRYFALKHGDKPDFHQRNHHVFVLRDEL